MRRLDPKIGDGFWNIRGSFRIAGLIDVGTQASLVQRHNGNFVLLDACSFTDKTLQQIHALTGNGERIEAILHVHPFHTLHVQAAHELFPRARLYGTARHHAQQPQLPWQPERTETDALHALFADDFEFSVPAGVDFISRNENVHFSSVLVWHGATKTIHVDDTLMYIRMPLPVRMLGIADTVRFHPTLSSALQRRAGAAEAFGEWANSLVERWPTAENLCAAHTAPLLAANNTGDAIRERIAKAIETAATVLASHARRYSGA